MKSILALLYFINLAILATTSNNVHIHSSCSDIHRNGLYYIKPRSDGAVIPVLCSNGYTMLDLSLDKHLASYPSYLTSYTYVRDSFDWIIPSLDDESSFKEWWTPSDTDTKFRVAQNCESCSTSGDFGDDVVYYTDSALFCFASTPSSGCIAELNEYACNVCDVGNTDSTDITSRTWTKCTALQMRSDSPINYDHDECVTHGLVYRPVMSLIRDACTCYKPSQTSIMYQISSDELPKVTLDTDGQKHLKHIDDLIVFDDDDDNDDEINCDSNIVYLNNSDFVDGTYRIRSCGEYILNQDIIFNFNTPNIDEMNDDSFSPNSIDVNDLYWFPTHLQEQSGDYIGTYTYSGSYSLGFFAGITVETDNVRINLNGYSLQMDPVFYFQQRYFTLIECGAKYFLPNQGPSNWGIKEEYYAANLEIFGGTLGLSSHHGIHGMRNQNIYIHDVEITSFEVAGIQCNGCNNVLIESSVIGPQNTNIPVLGRYAHARAMLPRLKQFTDEYGRETVTFSNRETTTIDSLIDRLIQQMDMVYNNAIKGEEYEVDDEEWIAAQKLFINPSGWMDGGSSYGAVFNGDGAAVVGMGSRIQSTSNISMNNVEIFGIYNAVKEKIKVSINKVGATRLILFDTVDWIAVTDSIEDGLTAQYIGDAYTDIIFAIKQHITSWSYLNSLYITTPELQYVFEGNNAENQAFRAIWQGGSPAHNDESASGCNTDIQLHSSKGAIGLRFDGVENIQIDNIYIHDVVNWADLGANWCGLSDGPGVSNEDHDIQYGYTGTRAHGLVIDYVSGSIQNVQIANIESLNGEAIGINVYKGCEVQISQITVHQIGAGTQLTIDDAAQLTLPNLVPRACAVDVHDDTIVSLLEDVTQSNVIGHINCDDNGDIFSADTNNVISSSFYNAVGVFGVIKIVVIVLSVMVSIGICFCNCIIKQYLYKQNKDDNTIESQMISTEYTPLLV